ncbi:helix-turn-helix domain-containing protein [Streptomyces sp. NPDC049967]|uniref:helix-turn-helix transcriptional regulator n=1 Tax=Streptomyces sp. NPDC049967 TaxID=3155658 RepID=UPI003440E47C
MSVADLLTLPAAIDLVTAGRALGLGRTTAYDLAKRGEFPVPLMKLGAQYRCTRASLFRLLDIEQPTASPAA